LGFRGRQEERQIDKKAFNFGEDICLGFSEADFYPAKYLFFEFPKRLVHRVKYLTARWSNIKYKLALTLDEC
jgi:hypothetical protein